MNYDVEYRVPVDQPYDDDDDDRMRHGSMFVRGVDFRHIPGVIARHERVKVGDVVIVEAKLNDALLVEDIDDLDAFKALLLAELLSYRYAATASDVDAIVADASERGVTVVDAAGQWLHLRRPGPRYEGQSARSIANSAPSPEWLMGSVMRATRRTR